MNKLLARIGGSHRKYAEQCAAFEQAGIAMRGAGSASLGSKYQHAIIPDTLEARELLYRVGGNLAKRQWKHLCQDNENQT